MTALPRWACPCSLHPRKVHTDPCRLCASKHPTSRSAHVQPSAVRSGSAEDNRGLTEGPESAGKAGRRLDSDSPIRTGPSPDPALRRLAEPRRARRVHAGSPSHGDSMEPGSPRSGSAVAASGSRST